MSFFTREEIKNLTRTKQTGPCVSIYMPTQEAGPETRQNPIRFKNLVTEAEAQLIAGGLRPPEARELLQPAEALIEDYPFWQHQRQGLALFVGPELFYTHRLPLRFEELVVVAQRFQLKPVLPLLGLEAQFYVLALSQNEVRLFSGTPDSMEPIELEAMPASLAETLRFDEPRKQQQFHTATASPGGAGGQRPAIFHGQGGGEEETNSNLLRFCQQLNRGLKELWAGDETPLVLAAPDYLIPIYREANSYPHLLRHSINRNPQMMSAADLHDQAWALIQANFEQQRAATKSRFADLTGTSQISNDLSQIVPAAYYGQVEVLFVAQGEQRWGTFDPDSHTLHVHPVATSGSDDLLDAAAVQTFIQGGTVYPVAGEDVPGGPPVAAIFRYPI